MLAVLIFFNSTAFSASSVLICASIEETLPLASLNSPSSSERSRLFSVTDVCMAHSLVWAFSELPHFRHLYWVVPCPSVTPSEQVTLIVTLSHPFSLAASVA